MQRGNQFTSHHAIPLQQREEFSLLPFCVRFKFLLLRNACLHAWKDGHDWVILNVHFLLMAEGGMEGRGLTYEWLTKGIYLCGIGLF